jgi:DNA-binding NarL/FixJ family response regulator
MVTGNGRPYLCTACRTKASKKRYLRGELLGKPLSNRELAVVALLHLSNKDIAYKLKLTPGTIKEYLCQIFLKLGANNRTDAALKFRKAA